MNLNFNSKQGRSTMVVWIILLCSITEAFGYRLKYEPMDHNNLTIRDPKLLSPFTIVRFANSECTQGDDWTGVCYTLWDCHTGFWGEKQISAVEDCTSGFGKCCVAKIGCGATTNKNNTWLTSPGFGGETFNYGLDCEQTVMIDSSICQLRLEVKYLELYYPNVRGICDYDWLTVSHDNKFKKLCGITRDNHFYLDVDANTNTKVTFNFHTDGGASIDRKWAIMVSKIECHSPEEVPRGCGQHYTGTSHLIRGFNMHSPEAHNYILDGLNYAICVRMELDYCSITYTENKADKDGWLTVCPDIFERPGRPDSITQTTELKKCMTTNGVTNYPTSYTISYLTPHLFLLDTTRSSDNSHKNGLATNNRGVYDIKYSATKCT